MRKLRKLARSPGLYFRDYFLKRYPIHTVNQDSILTSQSDGVIKGRKSHLSDFDLRITGQVAGAGAVDVSVFDLDYLLSLLVRVCAAESLRLFFLNAHAVPTLLRTSAKLAEATELGRRKGYLELRLVDNLDYLIESHRLSCWQPADASSLASLRCLDPRAPVKIWRDGGGASEPGRVTDLSPAAPIDVVLTWVNARDPVWQALISPYRAQAEIDPDRYVQADELRYAIRSIELYAPWVRRIHVLTNCSKPPWFRGSARHRWVDHAEAIPETYLPLFSSHAIETFLHCMPDLAENFIYMNDDVMLFNRCEPDDFYAYGNRSISFFEPYGTVLFYDHCAGTCELDEWQHAAVNGARLIQRDFGVFPTRLHQHVPHVMKASVYRELEQSYRNEIHNVRKNRFRDPSDISFTSFFYHHYANMTGSSVPHTSRSFIVRNTNYRSFHRGIERSPDMYKFICINDGNGSAQDAAYNTYKTQLLADKFPFKSIAEP